MRTVSKTDPSYHVMEVNPVYSVRFPRYCIDAKRLEKLDYTHSNPVKTRTREASVSVDLEQRLFYANGIPGLIPVEPVSVNTSADTKVKTPRVNATRGHPNRVWHSTCR